MLSMVTKNFYDRSALALRFFQGLGEEFDEAAAWVEALKWESFPQTCTWSVGLWEFLYDITSDERLSLDVRRQQIMARVLYRAPINPETIRAVVVALTGANGVELNDFVAPYTFEVIVEHDEPIENMTQVWEFVYRMKPSHLSFRLYLRLNLEVEHTVGVAGLGGVHRQTDLGQVVEITQADWLRAQEGGM